MCKVTIKAVEKFLKGATGETNGKPWELHVFKCRVSVDGSPEEAVRTCKTFDAEIAQRIKAMPEGHVLTFEAKKEGAEPPYDFMLVPEKKQKRGTEAQGGRGTEKSNRQAALQMAYENAKMLAVAEGGVKNIQAIIQDAEELLAWLEQGGAK